MAITQNTRLVQVDSPLGGDVLLLQSMEAVSYTHLTLPTTPYV